MNNLKQIKQWVAENGYQDEFGSVVVNECRLTELIDTLEEPEEAAKIEQIKQWSEKRKGTFVEHDDLIDKIDTLQAASVPAEPVEEPEPSEELHKYLVSVTQEAIERAKDDHPESSPSKIEYWKAGIVYLAKNIADISLRRKAMLAANKGSE